MIGKRFWKRIRLNGLRARRSDFAPEPLSSIPASGYLNAAKQA
ncbi:hypothetical protein CEV31_3629 [Brucella thiophenivorans]|uniref:Uncharacterized protein n=1 Tax=Brucella thiophenivorans TaxID=571255 RepID=A0A256FBJ9_9HYPH|nr:hypothetical protein CEV31_3629 [Brucella thiophenivorans]